MLRFVLLVVALLLGVYTIGTGALNTASVSVTEISATNVTLFLNTSALATNCSITFSSANSTAYSIVLNINTAGLSSPSVSNTSAANYTLSFNPQASLGPFPGWMASAVPWTFLQSGTYNVSAACSNGTVAFTQAIVSQFTMTGAACANTSTFSLATGCTTCATGFVNDSLTTCNTCAPKYYGTLCQYNCIHGSLSVAGPLTCNCRGGYGGPQCDQTDNGSWNSAQGVLLAVAIGIGGLIGSVAILAYIQYLCRKQVTVEEKSVTGMPSWGKTKKPCCQSMTYANPYCSCNTQMDSIEEADDDDEVED